MRKLIGTWTKNIISKLITVVCVGVFLYATYGLFDIFIDYYENRKIIDDLQTQFHEASEVDEVNFQNESGEKQIRPGFQGLMEQNDDVVGWITIDDTKIDYPIVQAEDNAVYLNRNFFNEETRLGSIFMDYRNDITSDNERNLILYGHRTKDGSMFQHLTKFLDEDFYREHRTFEFDILYDQYEAEIFAVYNTLTDFDYIQTEFLRDEDFENFLQEIDHWSKFEDDVHIG